MNFLTFGSRIAGVVCAAFSAFASVPAHAALIDFSFSGEVTAINTSDVFFSNLFSVGASGSGHLVLDYDEDPATAVINSFSAMIGLTNFSMAAGADQEVRLENDVGHLLQIADLARFSTSDLLGPSFFGYSATAMDLRLYDLSETVFSSDTPSALELTGLSGADDQFLIVFFENGLGEGAGSIVLRPSDRISVDVISPVPLPGGLGLALSGLAGFGVISRRKRNLIGDQTIPS